MIALAATQAGAQEIVWQTNYSQARQLAAEQRRLILLHFYTDNCEPCRLVEKQVFPDRNVVDAVEKNFIPVKLHERDNSELARRYGVSRFPTDVIVTHTGQPLHRGLCPTSAREYTLLLNNIALQSGVGAARTVQASATSLLPSREQMSQFKQGAGEEASQLAGQAQQTAASAATQWNQSANQLATQATGAANQVADQAWQTANQTANQAYQNANEVATQATEQANITVNQTVSGVADQATSQVNGLAAQANSWVGSAAAAANNFGGAYAAPPTASMVAAPNTAVSNVTPPNPAAQYAAPPMTVNHRYGAPAAGHEQPTPSAHPANSAVYSPPGGAYGQPAMQSAPPAANPPTAQPWQSPPPIPPVGNPPVQNAGYAAGPTYAPQPAAPAPSGAQMVPVTAAPAQGLDGYCPVTLVEKRIWRKGDVRFGAVHRGRTYLFGSEEAQKQFLANPDHFAPILSGLDAVQYSSNGRTVEGKRDFGVVYRGQVYLFENAASRDAFEKAPDRFVTAAQQAMLKSEQGATVYR
jgi:YHS domain-containing protein